MYPGAHEVKHEAMIFVSGAKVDGAVSQPTPESQMVSFKGLREVEHRRFELLTSSLRTKRSTN